MDYFNLNQSADQIRAISNLGLAHIGDCVYELMIRSWLCLHGKATNRGLHKATVKYVSAPAQAKFAGKILSLLTQEEADVFRRGRNSSPGGANRGGNSGRAASRDEHVGFMGDGDCSCIENFGRHVRLFPLTKFQIRGNDCGRFLSR